MKEDFVDVKKLWFQVCFLNCYEDFTLNMKDAKNVTSIILYKTLNIFEQNK